jgi:hypothetical protein
MSKSAPLIPRREQTDTIGARVTDALRGYVVVIVRQQDDIGIQSLDTALYGIAVRGLCVLRSSPRTSTIHFQLSVFGEWP